PHPRSGRPCAGPARGLRPRRRDRAPRRRRRPADHPRDRPRPRRRVGRAGRRPHPPGGIRPAVRGPVPRDDPPLPRPPAPRPRHARGPGTGRRTPALLRSRPPAAGRGGPQPHARPAAPCRRIPRPPGPRHPRPRVTGRPPRGGGPTPGRRARSAPAGADTDHAETSAPLDRRAPAPYFSFHSRTHPEMLPMRRLVLLLAAGFVVSAGCGGEIVVQAQLEGEDGAEPLTLASLPVRVLPYDRDALFDSLAAAYPVPEPTIPDSVMQLREQMLAAQAEWQR